MPQISYINYQDIIEAHRFDAEYFLPKYLEIENTLKKHTSIFIKDCATFSNGCAYNSDDFISDGEIYVSKIGDVTNKRDFYNWDRIKFKHFFEKHGKFLKNDDILMTLTGDPPDVGKVNLIFDPPQKKLTWNQRVALLRLKNKKEIASAQYLFIVLSSKYCRDYIERLSKGIRQRNVGNDAVRKLLIPLLPQSFQLQIEQIVKSAHQKQALAKQLYQEAEKLLLQELEMLDFQVEHALTFATTKKQVDQAQRIDSEYFQPKYEDIIRKIEKYDC